MTVSRSWPACCRPCVARDWSEGVTYVQPPVGVLNALVAIRVQLDPDADGTGPLEVLPGSHRARLDAEALRELRQRTESTRCVVPLGGALVMRPLLVHASAKARRPAPRRVLHFLFGPPDLPHGLRWPDEVSRCEAVRR